MKYVVIHIHIKIENHADWGNECITNMRIQPDSEKKINQSKDQAVRRCKTYMKCRVRVRVNQEAQKKKRNPE